MHVLEKRKVARQDAEERRRAATVWSSGRPQWKCCGSDVGEETGAAKVMCEAKTVSKVDAEVGSGTRGLFECVAAVTVVELDMPRLL